MKLLKLSFAGIGPYPGEHTIDFEAIGESGLFLLSGPTGSGKSTIIDAIAFALFSDVAGEKDSSRDRLRSDFCAPQDPSYVRLTFSVPSGTYVVERTPQYTKPGNKTPTAAKASLWKILPDNETPQPIATKASQVGHEISSLLPLKKDQFLQTVVLPQGKFNKFLSAESGEREKLLRTIFGTQIFTNVIEQLKLRTRTYETQLDAMEQKLIQIHSSYQEYWDNLLNTWEELSAVGKQNTEETLEASTPEHSLAPFLQPQLLSEPLSAHLDSLKQILKDDCAVLTKKTDAGKQYAHEWRILQQKAADTLTHARRQLELKSKKQQALHELEQLKAEAAKIDSLRKIVQLFKMAEPLQKIRKQELDKVSDVARLEDTCQQTTLRLEEFCNSEAGQGLQQLQIADIERRENNQINIIFSDSADAKVIEQRHLSRLLETIHTAKYLSKEKTSVTDSLDQLKETQLSNKTKTEQCQLRLEELEKQKAQLCRESKAAEQQMQQKDSLELQKKELEKQLLDWNTAQSLQNQLEEQDKIVSQLQAQHQKANETFTQMLTQWQENTASRLAENLSPNHPCPVCGSVDHPKPAAHQTKALTEEELERAQQLVQTIGDEYLKAKTISSEIAAQHSQIRTNLKFENLEDLESEIEAASAGYKQALQAGKDYETNQRKIAEIETETDAKQQDLQNFTAQKTNADVRLEEQKESLASISSAIDKLVSPYQSITAAEDAITRANSYLKQIEESQKNLDTAREVLRSVESRSGQELAASPFNSWDEVRAALQDSHVAAEYEAEISAHEKALMKVESTLADPEIKSLDLEAPTADIAALEETYQQVSDSTQEIAELNGSLQNTAQLIQAAETKLVEQFKTVVKYLATNKALLKVSRLVQGKGSDSEESISLATYVLVSRLEDILAHANPILSEISNGRYELTRINKESGQKTRSTGLGLEIIDHFTNLHRSTKTLSGGEAFYTSLSLALALSSVVTAETGGIEIETMFIDEGFGTLSPDYLDAVITQLHQLAQNGTVVGLISHVDELKRQIGDKIQVEKNQAGYSVLKTNF